MPHKNEMRLRWNQRGPHADGPRGLTPPECRYPQCKDALPCSIPLLRPSEPVRFYGGGTFYPDSMRLGKSMAQRSRDTASAVVAAGVSHSRQDDPPEGQLPVRRWYFLASRLPGQLATKSIGGLSTRRFIEAVLWIAATDSTWPQLPKSYGNFHAVYQRFARWARLDVWDYVSTCLEGDPRLPALQRLVRQHLEIRRRRTKPVEQTVVSETVPSVATPMDRINELEARIARMERMLRAVLKAFPQVAEDFPELENGD